MPDQALKWLIILGNSIYQIAFKRELLQWAAISDQQMVHSNSYKIVKADEISLTGKNLLIV